MGLGVKHSHLKLIRFVSVSSVLFVPPTHLLVMQLVLWNAPDFFSILSVICVSDALVKSADPICQKNIALMMQKSQFFCCILQCFVNFNILPQATKKSALEIFTPPNPPPQNLPGRNSKRSSSLSAVTISNFHPPPTPPRQNLPGKKSKRYSSCGPWCQKTLILS